MAFPEDDIAVYSSAAFGADLTAAPSTWARTDLTDRIIATPLTISRRAIVGTNRTGPPAATGLTLLNDDGWLTPFLPSSPWWPYVDVGTPIDLAIRTTSTPYVYDTFTRTSASGWGAADNGAAWTAVGTVWPVTGGQGRFQTVSTASIFGNRLVIDHTDLACQFDVGITAVPTGAPTVFGSMLRFDASTTRGLWPAIEFSPGGTVLWTVRGYSGGVASTLVQTPEPGLTYSAGTMLRVRTEVVGERLRCKAWLAAGVEPATWTIDYQITKPEHLLPSTHMGVRAWVVAGTSNTLPNPVLVDNVTFEQPKVPRIEGYITDVRPSFWVDPDGTEHSTVQVDIGGVNSRLERNEAPAWSPMRRSLQLSNTPPYAYWPLEDASGAQSAASAYPGHQPMAVTGPAVFDFDIGIPDDDLLAQYGSLGLTSVAAGARLSALVVAAPTSGSWTVSASIQEPTYLVGGGVTEIRQLEWHTGGTYTRWALVGTTTGTTVRAYNDQAGTSTNVCSYAHGITQLMTIDVTATQSGGNISVQFLISANVYASGSVAGSIGTVTQVTVNPDRANTTASTSPQGIRFLAGHIMVTDAVVAGALPYYFDNGQLTRADRAWTYERLHRRLLRLADEEAVPCRVSGDPYTTGVTMVGPQPAGAFVELAKNTVDTDSGGTLYEAEYGYVHRARTGRYNPPVTLTVDVPSYQYSQAISRDDVLQPSLDARGPNSWTVQRRGGSSGTYAAPQVYRKRRGTIAQSATLDLLYDTDAEPHATWRTHLSVDGADTNYPGFPLDLAANPDLINGWLSCTIGSRIQRTGQPTIAGIGTVDQVIDGWSETIVPRSAGGPQWSAQVDVSPAGVWLVGIYDDPSTPADSSSTTTSALVNGSATSIGLKTVLAGDVWGTPAPSYVIVINGERMTVTNMTAASFSAGTWNQTATVTRGLDGFTKTHAAGSEVHADNSAFGGL